MRVKTIYVKDKEKYNLSQFPNFSATGCVKGMKNKYYGQNSFLVKCGGYIYNVTSQPTIWDKAH